MAGKKIRGIRRSRRLLVEAPSRAPKPTLHLTGSAARALFKHKPGARVTARIHGRLTNVGLDRYTPGNPASATIEIHRTVVRGGDKPDASGVLLG